MKRVFLVHGWSGTPDNHWFPWLAHELRNKGFRVETPAMPEADTPKIEPWVAALAKAVGTPDAETYFIGHSIGCQTILRYFMTITEKVGGAVLVAPFYTLTGLSEPEEIIAHPWLTEAVNDIQVMSVCPKMECIFSDNDEHVPLSNVEQFEKRYSAKIVMEHEKGHLAEGITQLSSALNAILIFTR